MTKITVEIYVDHGVVTRVKKAVDDNFKEPEYVIDMMFNEIEENNIESSSYWNLDEVNRITVVKENL